jgi:hypothetical protein
MDKNNNFDTILITADIRGVALLDLELGLIS